MEQPTQEAETHKKELIIGAIVILAVVALVVAIALFAYSKTPKVMYQPAKACDLFTSAEARDLLGSKALKSSAEKPVLTGNTATSACGYTDGNRDTNNMVVAAINVRSGVNDEGVKQNKTEFDSGKPAEHVETVKDLGDSAYFNQENGQLNILDGRRWIIVSYGIGSAPQGNELKKAVALGKKVLD